MRHSGLARNVPDIWPFVVSGVVPNHVDEAFIGVARLDLGEKLCGAAPVHRSGLNKGRIEILKAQRAMDVHPPAPCSGRHGGVRVSDVSANGTD